MAEEDMHPMDTLPVEDLVGPALSCIFPYKYFNAMQTIVANQAFHSTKNMVVAAPTGCGKTCVLDLSIAKHIAEGEAFKCLYIAPNKVPLCLAITFVPLK